MSKKYNMTIRVLVRHIESIPKLYKSFDFSNKHQKYKLDEYLTDILFVLKTGIAWRDLRSHINWNSVYKIYIKLNTFNIFSISYTSLLHKYIQRSPNKKLRYILTDTSFIPNKHGHNVVGYNKFYNRKKGTKISLITDSNGIALDVKCYSGNRYDSTILLDQFRNCNLVQYNHNANQNYYFIADAGYDCHAIREKVIDMNYVPLIRQNKRRIKDKNKIIILSKSKKEILKKRIKVENTFNKLKVNRRLLNRYDSKIETFKGFIYLALIKIICGQKS